MVIVLHPRLTTDLLGHVIRSSCYIRVSHSLAAFENASTPNEVDVHSNSKTFSEIPEEGECTNARNARKLDTFAVLKSSVCRYGRWRTGRADALVCEVHMLLQDLGFLAAGGVKAVKLGWADKWCRLRKGRSLPFLKMI